MKTLNHKHFLCRRCFALDRKDNVLGDISGAVYFSPHIEVLSKKLTTSSIIILFQSLYISFTYVHSYITVTSILALYLAVDSRCDCRCHHHHHHHLMTTTMTPQSFDPVDAKLILQYLLVLDYKVATTE